MKPQISVIIANYNNDQYLTDCLRSVQTQSFENWECIIVDDGSHDQSGKIIRQFAKTDSRFKPIFQKNSGASAARNAGLDIARGDWITFLDSDDCFTPGALGLLYTLAVQNNVDIACGGGVRVADDFKLAGAKDDNYKNPPFIIFGTTPEDLIKMSMLGDTHRFVWVWRRLFRRDLIGDLRFDPDLFPGEDTCFMLAVLPHAKRILESRSMVVYHRMAQTSVSNAAFNQKSFQYITPTLIRLRQIMDQYYAPVFQRFFYPRFMNLVLSDTVFKSMTNRRLMNQIADHLRPVYRTRALPLRYLPLRRRVIFWLFMKVYS